MHFTKISTCKNTFFFYTLPFPIIFFIFFSGKGRKLKFFLVDIAFYIYQILSIYLCLSIIYINIPLDGLLTRVFEFLYYAIQNKLQKNLLFLGPTPQVNKKVPPKWRNFLLVIYILLF